MDAPRPIFLVGCPRSGTTLLSAMLHAHPNIAMPPETRFLIPAYRHRDRFGDLRERANRRRLARRITNPSSKFDDLRLERSAVVRAIVAAPPTLGSAFATVWQEFARDRGKQRWGEKRPAYWREMDAVLRLFPTAQIIHLVRDPRSCVASLDRVPWWDRSVANSTSLWVSADHALSRLGRHLPSESYHRLRYEDLTTDPRGALTRLCGFLGEPFSEQMLDHAAASADIVPERKRWHELVHGEVDPARIDVWRTRLPPEQIRLVEVAAGPTMRRYGYRRSEVPGRPRAGELSEYAWTRMRTQAWLAKRRAEDARLRHRFPVPLAAQL